ncbi:DNA repair protein RAD16 [Cyphellophora attinorum]|uniref:DNA repair protein RAD16 n=1 Tax=Cyphellophora attinorum TaxID=1664694 RepID=A0A0N0NS29_9EURO|nr:DNA repair protein RAD16 [Phialophora attinorum]KPI45778.1 DNA repair protein RAD16 [Phialophora attinorum]
MARTKKVAEASSRRSSRGRPSTTSVIATPEPAPVAPRGRSKLSKVVIENSQSSDIEIKAEVSPEQKSTSFLGVFVPPTKNASVDYTTPATSAMNTPVAESSTKVTAKTRALELRGLADKFGTRSTSKKRKVEDDFDDFRAAADAKLAARLQAEEYGEDATMSVDLDEDEELSVDIPRKRVKRESSEELSEVIDLDSEDNVPLINSRKANGKGKAVVRQPSIAASDMSSDLSIHSSMDSSEFSYGTATSDDEDDEADDLDIASLNPTVVAQAVARRAVGGGRRKRGRGRMTRAERERAKLEKSHPEIKTMWDDLKAVKPIKPVAGDQPDGINRKLKGFQLEGVDWMIKQERSQWRGGLLGDEMGMGKTIQAVSLIMSDFPAKAPALVVVPPVALMQWKAEIESYTDGKLSVLVYHISANPKCKNMTLKELKKFNVIMVSYSSLESMYRKESKGWNRNDGLVKEDSVLHAIKYHRIILDEAHSIKSRTTGVARACFALNADYKWCLSGTPVQNRIGEFFSLLRFLELAPFACYFCKQCRCAELHWSQDHKKACTSCKHTGFNHVSVFNQEILNPITNSGSDVERKEALAKLRLITDRIMLRRLKRDHVSSMELPPKDVVIHNEFFGEIEQDFSNSIMKNSTRKFDTYVAQGVMLNNYANIFGMIMQMRQVANHPDLILRKNAEGGQNVLVCCICDEPAEEAIRSRCHHEFCRQCAKNYIQAFDGKGDSDAECPRCHIPLSIDWDQPDIEQDEENVKKSSIINRIKMENWTSSTKIEMLVYDLYKLRSHKQTRKSIVFSQFTSMLQLVQWRLQKSGFSTVLLDGSMTPSQRQKSIEYFMNNVEVEVFLVSLKAGGVALNLTEASNVFIIDPWWNPAAEWQSADRCHRIGQRRPCKITRLCIEDSVESRMVLLQEKKANMINGTVNNDQVALDKLTPEDMQFLFRGS